MWCIGLNPGHIPKKPNNCGHIQGVINAMHMLELISISDLVLIYRFSSKDLLKNFLIFSKNFKTNMFLLEIPMYNVFKNI